MNHWDTVGNLKVEINKIGYYFRGFEDYLEPFKDGNSNHSLNTRADFCQVDVACSPENIGWSEQIDAVFILLILIPILSMFVLDL